MRCPWSASARAAPDRPRLDLSRGLRTDPADELRFRQVLLNLLSNAVKFTDGRRIVTVSAWLEGATFSSR
jgi:signal transduction histidine kinase